MKNFLMLLFILPMLAGCQNIAERTTYFPQQTIYLDSLPVKENVWVFIMGGQSNMAGRAFVEPQDTISHPRIISVNKENRLIYAKEPLHYYQPKLTGLDCGMSFAQELIPQLDENTVILLLPCAVGGSSTSYWLNDSIFNGVHLKSNFIEKVELAKKYGSLKGILWHQGESDAFEGKIPSYENNLKELFTFFREYAENDSLPIMMGELGTYPIKEIMKNNWSLINEIIHQVADTDKNCSLILTSDLKPKADFIHFDSKSQRILGKRYADKFISINLTNRKK